VPPDSTSDVTSQQLPLEALGSQSADSAAAPSRVGAETGPRPDFSHDDAPSGGPDIVAHADGSEHAAAGPATRGVVDRGRNARPEPDGANATTPSGKPSRGPMPRKLTEGDELEYRLARMFFWQGCYARRGVNLQRHFHPDPVQVTDLDLLAYEVSPQLELIKTIGEAKSGTGKSADKPLDRAIWLSGLMRFVQADRATLVTAIKPSTRVRETVRSLGVRAIGTDEIARWEVAWLPDALADCGSQGPTAFQDAEQTRVRCKAEPELERVYWFLRSEVWFLDEWQATKRLIGALDRLQPWWTPNLDDADAAALRWLYAEAISVLVLNIVALTGRSWAIASSDWTSVVADRLSEGAVPAHHMRALADSFDRFLGRALKEAKASNTLLVESMGAFRPSPPDWAQPLIELIERLSTSNCLIDLPRHTDLLMHERLVKRRHASPEALETISRASEDPGSAVQRPAWSTNPAHELLKQH
jgi:hypothetical protein